MRRKGSDRSSAFSWTGRHRRREKLWTASVLDLQEIADGLDVEGRRHRPLAYSRAVDEWPRHRRKVRARTW